MGVWDGMGASAKGPRAAREDRRAEAGCAFVQLWGAVHSPAGARQHVRCDALVRSALAPGACQAHPGQGSMADDEIRTLRQALEEKESSLREPGPENLTQAGLH